MNRKERKIEIMYRAFVLTVAALFSAAAPLQAETREIIVIVENLATSGGF